MSLARTIVAVVVAISLAILPVVGGIAAPANMAMAAESVAAPVDHDCCDDAGTPAHKAMDECQRGTGCAFNCLSFVAPSCLAVLPPPASAVGLAFAEQIHWLHAAYPPFRPPRV